MTGLIVNKNHISRVTVEKWMTHQDLDVDWRPCRRDNDPRVTEFLAQSALHDDFFAARAGGEADRVPYLRVDKIGPSAPNKRGRKPKRPQPDSGFIDAGGARMPAPARALPAPADSTPPGAAAAAGAAAASGPPPSPAAPAADPAAPAGDLATTPPISAAGLSDASRPAGAGGGSGPPPSERSPAAPATDLPAAVGDTTTTLPTPTRLFDAGSPSPGSSPQQSDTPGSTGLSSPDTDSVCSSAAAGPRPRARSRARMPLQPLSTNQDTRMPISNNQDAGAAGQKAWELERQELIRRLAESEKENKGLKKDNQGLKKDNKCLKRRLDSNESKMQAKDTKIKSLTTDKKQLRDMYGKRLKRADGGRMMLENGKMGPLMTVQLRSIPTRKEKQARREAGGDSHKPYSRDYCPVLEKVVQAVDGPTQVRKGVGGWGFRLTDKLLHYDFLRRASQASGASIGEAVENTMIGKSRTGLLRVLARPLGGAQSRHKLDERRVDRLRVFQRPSPKVMRERVNPAMILALLRTARTKAEEATRIMVHFDATDFARYHVMGILLSFVFCVRQHTDPFGNVTYSVLIQRMPLHLQQTVNKLAKKVKMGATGAFWSPEAPRALCDAAALAGLTGLFTENELVSKLSSVTDAARDNVGLSKEKHPDTDAMCGENSPIHAIFFTGDALWNSCKRLEQAGMTRHLSQFYRGEKLPDLTQGLRRRRLALRRQQDLEKRQASGDTEVSVGADVAEVATLTDQVPSSPEGNAGDAAMPVAAAAAAAAGPGPAEAEVSTSRSSFCALPPEPRLPPPAIERSGPIIRCRERTSKLRSYAEGKLRAFFPGLLAMRWAFGFWRVKSVSAGLSKEERWRIHSEPLRSP